MINSEELYRLQQATKKWHTENSKKVKEQKAVKPYKYRPIDLSEAGIARRKARREKKQTK